MLREGVVSSGGPSNAHLALALWVVENADDLVLRLWRAGPLKGALVWDELNR